MLIPHWSHASIHQTFRPLSQFKFLHVTFEPRELSSSYALNSSKLMESLEEFLWPRTLGAKKKEKEKVKKIKKKREEKNVWWAPIVPQFTKIQAWQIIEQFDNVFSIAQYPVPGTPLVPRYLLQLCCFILGVSPFLPLPGKINIPMTGMRSALVSTRTISWLYDIHMADQPLLSIQAPHISLYQYNRDRAAMAFGLWWGSYIFERHRVIGEIAPTWENSWSPLLCNKSGGEPK